MRTSAEPQRDWIFLTGATGFVGAALLHALVSRGHRVLCLVRTGTPDEARRRLVEALRAWTRDGEHLLETGRIAAVRGDLHRPGCGLPADLVDALRGHVTSLVHAAGQTRFSEDAAGEPGHTNVLGTCHVLELASGLECRDWHFISTAYVAGAAREASEAIATTPPEFHNAYERSKWQAEQLLVSRARQGDAALTIYRPSVVVGHSQTGLTTQFTGIYYLFRATALLARAAEQQPDTDRHALPLRIAALPDRRPNLICVDDVAAAFMDLFETPAAHGGVYHLTHPAPPTNADIRRVLEAYYDIGGGRFIGETASEATHGARPAGTLGTFQQLFDQMTAPVRDYLFDAPRFDRSAVERFVPQRPAPWTDARLRRLVAAAETGGWRPSGFERTVAAAPDAIGTYFRQYLPQRLAASKIGRLERLDVTVRFEIGNAARGRWWCRFRGGQVAEAAPAQDQPAQVTYRTSESRFWAAVAGEITAAELFLAGEAKVDGDIERALKFAMVLEEFVREHPYRRDEPLTTTDARPRQAAT